jgi:hypothetical protein
VSSERIEGASHCVMRCPSGRYHHLANVRDLHDENAATSSTPTPHGHIRRRKTPRRRRLRDARAPVLNAGELAITAVHVHVKAPAVCMPCPAGEPVGAGGGGVSGVGREDISSAADADIGDAHGQCGQSA